MTTISIAAPVTLPELLSALAALNLNISRNAAGHVVITPTSIAALSAVFSAQSVSNTASSHTSSAPSTGAVGNAAALVSPSGAPAPVLAPVTPAPAPVPVMVTPTTAQAPAPVGTPAPAPADAPTPTVVPAAVTTTAQASAPVVSPPVPAVSPPPVPTIAPPPKPAVVPALTNAPAATPTPLPVVAATAIAPAVVVASAPLVIAPPPATPSGRGHTHYAMTIGRQVGVFAGAHHVSALTSGVSGGSCKGFNSQPEAAAYFNDALINGNVHIRP